jgi:hypothetical protein
VLFVSFFIPVMLLVAGLFTGLAFQHVSLLVRSIGLASRSNS